MDSTWQPEPTTTHQHHVIAHVLGARALGYFIHDEVLHLVLDMEFIWTIFLDGQMGLLPQGVAISELGIDAATAALLRKEIDGLRNTGHVAPDQMLVMSPPADCLIVEVKLFARGAERRLVLIGETGNLTIETSIERGTFSVSSDG